jgi:hypothetical protein
MKRFLFKSDSRSSGDRSSERTGDRTEPGPEVMTADEAIKYIDQILESDFNFNYFMTQAFNKINTGIKNKEFAINIRKDSNELFNRRLAAILTSKGYRVYDNTMTKYSQDDYENISVLTVEYYK